MYTPPKGIVWKGHVPKLSSPGVILKDVLDALAMVDIPVNNEDPGFRVQWGSDM